MNSAIQLWQSHLPVAPGRLSSSSRAHVSSSHGCVGVSKRGHLVSRPFPPDRVSLGSKMNEENRVGALKMNPKPKGRGGYALRPPKACGPQPQANDGSITSFDSLWELMICGSGPDVAKIEAVKLYAMALLSSKADAEKILQNWSASSTPLKLALIELLIYQKKYQKASEELNALMKGEEANGYMGVAEDEIYLLKALLDSIRIYGRKLDQIPAQEIKEAANSWEEFHEAWKSSPYNVKRRSIFDA